MKLATVAIVGRPNVGKSSLFNRMLQRQLAVVHERPGITRDRNYAVCDWAGTTFNLVDTGGMAPDSDDLMEQLVHDQTEFALNESDLVLFLVDTQVGLDTTDRQIARRLQQAGKECLLVANKVDSDQDESEVYQFLALGIGDPIAVSAKVGLGVGDLLDRVIDCLPRQETTDIDSGSTIRVAVVGRPNVGKSSFINVLVGQPRLLVTPMAGTTRDAVDTPWEMDGQEFVLVDTAGLRRKYKIRENVEFYTSLRTVRAIDGCDVAIVMVDAVDGLTTQDRRILDQVFTSRRSALMAVNKWDLVEKDPTTADRYTKAINAILARYAHLPVIYVSSLTGQRVAKAMSIASGVYHEARKRIATSELNEFLQKVLRRRQPPARQGKYIKINYVVQTEVAPPTFIFFANRPRLIDKSYIAFLSNQIRREYGFKGVPFRVKFRRK